MTRVQATRWMYENIESGATLHYETAGGEKGQLQLSPALPSPSTSPTVNGTHVPFVAARRTWSPPEW